MLKRVEDVIRARVLHQVTADHMFYYFGGETRQADRTIVMQDRTFAPSKRLGDISSILRDTTFAE